MVWQVLPEEAKAYRLHMTPKFIRKVCMASLVLGFVGLQPALMACATCFGKSDSALAQGMNMGIFSLLAVVVFIWVLIGAFFVTLARRQKKVQLGRKSDFKEQSYNTFVK